MLSKTEKETPRGLGKVLFGVNLIIVLLTILMWYFILYDKSFIGILLMMLGWPLPIVAGGLLLFSIFKKYWGRNLIFALHALNIGIFSFAFVNDRCTAFEMEENYESNKAEMDELVDYTCSVIKDTCYLSLEYSRWKPYDTNLPDSAMMAACDLTNEELKHIIHLLEQADCKGIMVSYNRVEVLYRREGMGAYYYYLRKPPVTDEIWAGLYNELGYTSTYYNDSVIFYYGAGAVGSWNFPRLGEYEQERPEIARRNEELKKLSRLRQ